jgi:hypothetical protein
MFLFVQVIVGELYRLNAYPRIVGYPDGKDIVTHFAHGYLRGSTMGELMSMGMDVKVLCLVKPIALSSSFLPGLIRHTLQNLLLKWHFMSTHSFQLPIRIKTLHLCDKLNHLLWSYCHVKLET